jgi:tRNA pseudouridine55 synthase
VKRRGATALLGILPIDKPAGMTSHDVVAAVRRATGEGRVGHAGTLDPMATGLLVVLIGAHTRLAPYLTSASKSYDATITFGTETDTDDAEGVPVRTAPVPPEVFEADNARRVLEGLLGISSQMPPAYSAIKVAGRTAHRAARAGEPLDLEPREIEVTRADLVSVEPLDSSWRVSFTVSKGTYVRALARDIGRACGCAAHLAALRRTSSGSLTLAGSHTLEEAASAASEGRLESLFAEPLAALGLPAVESVSGAVTFGAALDSPRDFAAPDGAAVSITQGGRLAAVYRVAERRLEPLVVLPGGDAE